MTSVRIQDKKYSETNIKIKTFQSTVSFSIETSHLIYSAHQMTGFYMECNTGLK